ncbi:uridine kinase [Aquabacterium sp.]|uniref:uridine kinase n=1 Tax=Aquabacterium sp. TaxID=1872578 RepID=UPI0035B1C7DA
MRKLMLQPYFLAGLVARVILIAVFRPWAESQWYLPFLMHGLEHSSLDPWSQFLDGGGNPAAFPYGYVTWMALMPLVWVAHLFGASLHFGYAGTLLVADFGLLLALRGLYPGHDRVLLLGYWLSPIVVLASYWLGLNDVLPVLLLTLALLAAQHMRLLTAGALCGAAVSAKLSMVLALPFFVIYLFQNKALRSSLRAYMTGLAFAVLVLLLPFVLSAGGVHMLVSNPEMGKVYQFALDMGPHTRLYLLPMAYVLVLYLTWQIRRLNFELFTAMLGLAFFLVVLMTPASPGWFIWVLPLMVAYQVRSDRVATWLTVAFTMLYAAGNITVMPWPAIAGHDSAWGSLANWQSAAHPILPTLLASVGVVLGWRIWRDTVKANDYFRLSRKPFVIGISGDSGAGKDTLSDALVDLFGAHSVATLSGDDYHLWDRQKPMWQVMTHLNPRANDLEAYAHDLLALADGRSIVSRHYDHSTGKMSLPHQVRSNDFVIASGLHTLYLPILRECYDLSIYLDIDEGLRRFLKLERDVKQRGHTAERVLSSLAKRAPDADRFIRPQAQHADLVMSLQPIHPRLLELDDAKQMRFKLQARSRQGLHEGSLARVLTGVCGLHVDMSLVDDSEHETELVIEGETTAEDVAMAAQMLFPEMLVFLDTKPKWKDGVLGLMQLIALSHIQQALKKRFLW